MTNVFEIRTEGKVQETRSALDELCLVGAQRMLHRALEFEVEQYMERYRDARDERGHALVTRNGKARPRKVTIGEDSSDCPHFLPQPTANNTVWTAFLENVDLLLEGEPPMSALPFADFDLADYHIEPAPPTQLIDEGDELDLGDRLLEVIHMPGHSPGSVCLYESATKTLFTGDVVYDGVLFDGLYHSDPERYLETLARLKEIPAETFHCGHYGSFGRERMPSVIEQYQGSKSVRENR